MAITWHGETTRTHAPQAAQTVGGFLVETVALIVFLAGLFGALPWLVQP